MPEERYRPDGKPLLPNQYAGDPQYLRHAASGGDLSDVEIENPFSFPEALTDINNEIADLLRQLNHQEIPDGETLSAAHSQLQDLLGAKKSLDNCTRLMTTIWDGSHQSAKALAELWKWSLAFGATCERAEWRPSQPMLVTGATTCDARSSGGRATAKLYPQEWQLVVTERNRRARTSNKKAAAIEIAYELSTGDFTGIDRSVNLSAETIRNKRVLR
ncbi:hypothetical protein Pla175_39090 [Pirellulimonas nuda]|uniref:Uncharacterized protein n=1 Tax=Pirellulimonas nuda TaxID=2528009 RepID=A0A518DGA1_9BACT|nr:hypothetical protein Pla175_39090 [Pirellulimonas nuda]